MVKNDRISMFYKGLFPAVMSQAFVMLAVEWSRHVSLLGEGFEHAWPLLYVLGLSLAVPMQVIACKVYCERFVNPKSHLLTGNEFGNVRFSSFEIMKKIMKTQGIKGFYVGLMPATVLYTAIYSNNLYYLGMHSYHKYLMNL